MVIPVTPFREFRIMAFFLTRWKPSSLLLLGAAGVGFVACIILAPLRPDPPFPLAASDDPALLRPDVDPTAVGAPGDFVEAAATDPVLALEMALDRTQKELLTYTCRMAKHETLNGTVHPAELAFCKFRQEPFSVFMEWEQGKDQADASLFVRDRYDNKILVRPAVPYKLYVLKKLGRFYAEVKPNSSEARNASRYNILEFGIERGAQRTWSAWKTAALDPSRPRASYLGLRKVPELDNQLCHTFHRVCNPPEEEGLTDITIYLNDRGMQVGSVLKAGGTMLGTYFFRDLVINPPLTDADFDPEVLRK